MPSWVPAVINVSRCDRTSGTFCFDRQPRIGRGVDRKLGSQDAERSATRINERSLKISSRSCNTNDRTYGEYVDGLAPPPYDPANVERFSPALRLAVEPSEARARS